MLNFEVWSWIHGLQFQVEVYIFFELQVSNLNWKSKFKIEVKVCETKFIDQSLKLNSKLKFIVTSDSKFKVEVCILCDVEVVLQSWNLMFENEVWSLYLNFWARRDSVVAPRIDVPWSKTYNQMSYVGFVIFFTVMCFLQL